MDEKQETIADFIEVRRARANEIESKAGGMLTHLQRQLIADLRDEADRLEAAWKREVDALTAKLDEARHCWKVWSDRADELLTMCNEQYAKLKTVGDAAKLREALVKIYNEVRSYCADYGAGESHRSLIDRVVNDPPDYTSYRDLILEIDRIVEAALATEQEGGKDGR